MTSVLVHGDQGLVVRRFRCAADGRRAQAPIESDGLGAAFMRRVCAWCRADLGVVACLPGEAAGITHGICPECSERLLAGLPGVKPLASGGGLHAGGSGLSAGDNALLAPSLDGRKPGSAPSVAAGQAATPRPSPLFWSVSGLDFGRTIRWARERWRNPLNEAVRAKINQIKGARK